MSKNIKLTEHTTVSYDDEYPHTIRVFLRSDPDTVDSVLELNAEFEQPWQAAVTRKRILEAGEINPDNWAEGSEYEPPAF